MVRKPKFGLMILLLAVIAVMAGLYFFLIKPTFGEKFSNAVYWPDRSSVYSYPKSQLALRVVGSKEKEKLFSILNKAGKNGKLEEVIIGNSLVHTIVFTDDFSETVTENKDEFYLIYHTPFFTLKNRAAFIEQNRECLFSSSANTERDLVLSLLMVNTNLTEKEIENCLLLYYLKMSGFSNIYYSDIGRYVEENGNEIVFTNFTKKALTALKNASETQLQSKQEMMSFIESPALTKAGFSAND